MPKRLVISVRRWLRATNDGYAGGSLYDKQSKRMCCLGFASRACGAKVKNIKNIGFPAAVKHVWTKALLRKQLPWLFNTAGDASSVLAYKLGEINDDDGTTDAFKKKEIKRIFKEHGVKVVFVP